MSSPILTFGCTVAKCRCKTGTFDLVPPATALATPTTITSDTDTTLPLLVLCKSCNHNLHHHTGLQPSVGSAMAGGSGKAGSSETPVRASVLTACVVGRRKLGSQPKTSKSASKSNVTGSGGRFTRTVDGNSAAGSGLSTTVEDVRGYISAVELQDRVFLDVDGVEEEFFGCGDNDIVDKGLKNMSLNDEQNEKEDEVEVELDLATSLDDRVFVPWLVAVLGQLAGLSGAGVWKDTRYTRELPGAFLSERRPDFCLMRTEPSGEVKVCWENILVVGEHQSKKKSEREALAQLADYVAHLFAHQPLRTRIHAVLTYNTSAEMTVFLFDRGGVLGSGRIPQGRKSLTALARVKPGSHDVVLQQQEGRRWKMGPPVCQRTGIVCRGTYCAYATPTSPVAADDNDSQPPPPYLLVKLSWRASARQSEGDLLALAAQRKVVCIAQHVAHWDITDITSVRRGLGATGTPYSLSGGASTAAAAEQQTITFDNRILSCIAMATIGMPVSHLSDALQVRHALLGALIGHASLYFTAKLLHRDVSAANVLYSRSALSYTTFPGDFFPHGCDGGIATLHGFIIDLDHAVTVPFALPGPTAAATIVPRSCAPHRTGTLPFMAIGVLAAAPHSYGHDLESFLYVLLWVCCGGELALPRWHTGSPMDIAQVRSGLMTNTDVFENLLGSFLPGFAGEEMKRLAREWRNLLFKYHPRNRRSASPSSRSSESSDDTEEGQTDKEEETVYIVPHRRPGLVAGKLTDWDAFGKMRDALHRTFES